MNLLSNQLQAAGESADIADIFAQLEVPTITGLPQHQGDISVIPASMVDDGYSRPTAPVPAVGVAVVQGEATSNTHLLLAVGPVFYLAREFDVELPTIGYLFVPEGSTAVLDHPEHGNSGIGAGEYVIRAKRTQAEALERVYD